MKSFITLLTLLCLSSFVNGQTIYSKAYGNAQNKPVIFIHGGPGGNATLFEGTTAQKLAGKGFYVIVYDRRGEGRSSDPNAIFTFNEAFQDLNTLYRKYNIERATLIGHSFGGLVATLFTEKYPQKVDALILAGALFSQQETYNHILGSVRKIYSGKGDASMLNEIAAIEKLDKNTAAYRKGCYELAGKNDFFTMPEATAEADSLRKKYDAGDFYKSNIRNPNAPVLFYKNETRNNIDTKPVLRKLKRDKVKLYAVYGKQDRIFSEAQMNDMKNITGTEKMRLIDNCSHYLFVDQQKEFIKIIAAWLRP